MAGERFIARQKPTGVPAAAGLTESARSIPDFIIYEALVVDVLLDESRPEYASDGYNIGAIKIRILPVHHGISDELLPWADPRDGEVKQFPLVGELVTVEKIRGNFFYTRKVPIARRVQENAMIGLNEALINVNQTFRATLDKTLQKHKFGKYFKPDSRIRPLKHFEGDTIIEGRMGHSIRFGSSISEASRNKLAPNIILRAGQAKNAEIDYVTSDQVFGLTLEDPVKDITSIWMTTDQTVSYTPTMIGAGSFHRELRAPLSFDGAQILAVSDRVILNSKKNETLIYSNKSIYLNSFKDTVVDTDSNIILTANLDIRQYSSRNIELKADDDIFLNAASDIIMSATEKTSIIASKIFIGSAQRDAEPLVGGTSLSIWLARLILTLMGTPPAVPPQVQSARPVFPTLPPVPGTATISHTFFGGFPTVLNPQIVAGLVKLYTELLPVNLGQSIVKLPWSGGPFTSRDNFVSMVNDRPVNPKNDFKKGDPMKVDNSDFKITNTSFRVV